MSRFIAYALFIMFAVMSQSQASSPAEDLDPEIQKFRTFLRQQAQENAAPAPQKRKHKKKHRHRAQGKDVHAFNREIKPYADLLIVCNSLLCPEETHEAMFVLDGLAALRVECGFEPEYDIEIAQLRAYLQRGLDFDNETGMHVKHMLSAIWNYVQVSTDGSHKYNILNSLFFYLKQNTLEAGGCYPGFAGRLMLVNGLLATDRHSLLMHHAEQMMFNELANANDNAGGVNNNNNNNNRGPASDAVNLDDQEELDLVLALSLSEK